MRTAMLAVLLVLAAAGTAPAQDAVVTGTQVAREAFCDNGVLASLSDVYHQADWQELQKKVRALLAERLVSDPPPLEESAGCPLASAGNGGKGSDDRHVFDPRRNVYLVVFLTKQGHVARVPVYDPVPEAFTNVLSTEGGKNGRPLYEVVLLRYAADSLASTYVVSTAADPAAAELGALAKAAVEIGAAALDEIRPFQAFMALASQMRDSLPDPPPPPPDPVRLEPRILVRKVSVPPFRSATVVVKDAFRSGGGSANGNGSAGKPIEAKTTWHAEPRRRLSLSLLTGASFFAAGATPAKIDDGIVVEDQISTLTTGAAVHLHPCGYQRTARDWSVCEGISAFVGGIAAPRPGLAFGLAYRVLPSAVLTAGGSVLLVDTRRDGDSFGSAPTNDEEPLGTGGRWAFFLGFGFPLM